MARHSILLFAAVGLYLRVSYGEPNTYTRKIGPGTAWLHMASEDERQEIRTRCADSIQLPPSGTRLRATHETTNSTANSNSLPHLRIVEGKGAWRGLFPYAAALSNEPTSEGREVYCGATLISHWHLITAAHCAVRHYSRRFYVVLDGVCVRRYWLPGECFSSEDVLRTAEVDFTITQYYYHGPRDDIYQHALWVTVFVLSPRHKTHHTLSDAISI